MAGIITNKGAKALAVGGWKDHVHILFGMPVTTKLLNDECHKAVVNG
ncbi:MAG: hypothetical protein IPN56_07725 [Chitinophagaceae bacterium]|nr:hypothetical protein [Chitinophagaceae bacterium]